MMRCPVSLEILYRTLKSDWFCQKVDASIYYKNGETEDTLLLKGEEILNLYFQDPVKKAVAAEYSFEVPLINQESGEKLSIPLQGVIDLIEDGDGIVEFKTGAKAMDKQSVANNLQLTIYAYAYWMLFKKEPKTLKIINFIKNKHPKMEILETTREQKDFQRLFYLVREVLKGIRNQIFFPRYSFLCADCEYADHCKKWQGNKN
jgi:CRISPR/Cas system-associated exonuclease Cas4 (RecB family)